MKSAKQIRSIKQLAPLADNPNNHTERGSGLMERSLRECGFGDSLTMDKNGVVISGTSAWRPLRTCEWKMR